MSRSVEQCRFRVNVDNTVGVESAECELVSTITGTAGFVARTPRETCECCCQLAPPNQQHPNAAVASLVHTAARHIVESGGVAGCGADRAIRLQRRTAGQLDLVPSASSNMGQTNVGDDATRPSDLIDKTIAVDSFRRHIERNEPFVYARYGDGEWLSMLGARGRNCDSHSYSPHTMGRELRQSFHDLARLSVTLPNIYVGLHVEWHQSEIQQYLNRCTSMLPDRFVDCRLLQWGLHDLSTKRFFESMRSFPGPKVLVANPRLRPVAHGLRCRHVVIPEKDCYLTIDRAEEACRFRGPGLVLLCASMASECLIGRLLRANPIGTYIDCGHIFDAMIFGPTRQYTRRDTDGISSILRTHYAPLFLDQRRTWARRLAIRLGRGN